MMSGSTSRTNSAQRCAHMNQTTHNGYIWVCWYNTGLSISSQRVPFVSSNFSDMVMPSRPVFSHVIHGCLPVLKWGCGWNPISIHTLQQNPHHVSELELTWMLLQCFQRHTTRETHTTLFTTYISISFAQLAQMMLKLRIIRSNHCLPCVPKK